MRKPTKIERKMIETYGSIKEFNDLAFRLGSMKRATEQFNEDTGFMVTSKTLKDIFLRHGMKYPIPKRKKYPKFLSLVKKYPDKTPFELLKIWRGEDAVATDPRYVSDYRNIRYAKKLVDAGIE